MKNNSLDMENIEAYIGPRSVEWYYEAFKNYEQNSLKFNIWACIFSFLYLFYRKCYKMGIIIGAIITLSSIFLGNIGSFINIVVSILCGLYGPKYVYMRYKEYLNIYKNLPKERLKINLIAIGGVSYKWVIIAILFCGIFSRIVEYLYYGI
ncbi:DUF2628 domain-containing protein [Cetobacterium sp. SF1]|uniref:DUF2628 domain-containing protein n=1 Tax=unclassified Cetobacterium TaxID=2630983 RepID=UPI003CEF826F